MNVNTVNPFAALFLSFVILFTSGCGQASRKTSDIVIPVKGEYYVSEVKADNLERKSISRTMFFHEGNIFQIGIRQYVDLTSNSSVDAVIVRYMGRSWLFLDGNVKIKIDGNLNKFKDDNPTRFVRSGSKYSNVGVTEEVVVVVPKEFIKQIATGGEVGIYFIGDPVYLNDKEKSFILRFYNENLLKTAGK